jgi:hypothetical protein
VFYNLNFKVTGGAPGTIAHGESSRSRANEIDFDRISSVNRRLKKAEPAGLHHRAFGVLCRHLNWGFQQNHSSNCDCNL